MKKFQVRTTLSGLCLLGAMNVVESAQAQNRSFDKEDKERVPLSAEDVCQRFRLDEEVLVFDASGKRIIEITRSDTSRPASRSSSSKDCVSSGTSTHSSNKFTGQLIYMFKWLIRPDGTMQVTFEQGAGREIGEKGQKITGSQGEKVVEVENFQPFLWVSPLHKSERVVVRLIPSLIPENNILPLDKFPIVLQDAVVFDSKGRLWSGSVTAQGEFLAFKTVHGSAFLSYRSFPGGKKMGSASGNELKLKLDDGTNVVIKSQAPLLAGNLASDVYVFFDPNMKSADIRSQHLMTGNEFEKSFEDFRKPSKR